jgi:hypothetical protein
MAISHIFTNAVPDATGTMTIWYGATTVTVAATDVVRPSDWNSAHYQFMSATGNTAGQSTFSGTNIVFGGGPNITLSGVNATRIDISAGAGGGGSLNLSAGTTSNNLTAVTFADSNGISFGLNASTVTATVRTNYASSSHSHAASAANGSFAFDTLSFSNANGVSFGTSAGNAVTASVAAQTNQTGGIYVTAQSTGQSSSSTYDLRTLSIIPDGIVSAGWSNGSFRISATQSNQAFSAGAASSTFQTLTFQDSNGLSFSNNAGAIRVSYTRNAASNAIQSVGSATGSGTNTSRFAADDHVHAGVFSVGVSNVGNSAGDTRVDVGRFVFAGGANITLSQATAANALNTVSIVGPAAGETRLTAYAVSNTTQSTSGTIPLSSLQFQGAGIASVGVSNGSVIVSVPAGGGGGDGGVFAGVSTGGNTAGSTGTVSTGNFVLVGSNGITLSQSTAAAGSHATVTIVGPAFNSRFWNGHNVNTQNVAMSNSFVSIVPFTLAHPYVASNLKIGGSINVATAANASSAYVDVSVSAVLYSRNVSTLSSILSASQSYTASFSSNATGSITGIQEFTVTHAATTLFQGSEYFWAIHVSTTNTATGGANTTALGNTMSMVVLQSSGQNNQMRPFGAGTDNTRGAILGQGMISTGATRATIAFSDYTVTGSRGVQAGLFFEHRNVTVY